MFTNSYILLYFAYTCFMSDLSCDERNALDESIDETEALTSNNPYELYYHPIPDDPEIGVVWEKSFGQLISDGSPGWYFTAHCQVCGNQFMPKLT